MMYSTCCQEKAIKEAYHVLCDNCASSKDVCAKCLESKEILVRYICVEWIVRDIYAHPFDIM